MAAFKTIAYILLASVWICQVFGSADITAPWVYHTGTVQQLKVNLRYYDNKTWNVTATLKELKSNETIAVATKTVPGYSVFTIDLKVPHKHESYRNITLDDLNRANVQLQVVGFSQDSDETFRWVKQRFLEMASGEVFIQTEKSIYNPGETVRLRVEVQKHDLKPFDGKIRQIIITNSQGVRITQWSGVDFKQGIANVALPLSTQLGLGKWTIRAIYRTQTLKEIVKCPSSPPADECPDQRDNLCDSDDQCRSYHGLFHSKCCLVECDKECRNGVVSRVPKVKDIEAEKTIIVKKYEKPKVFIQTEKSIYNPGETVRFRVVVQKHDLNGKIKQIIITNPQGDRIKQWNDVDFKDGIANVTLPLSTHPAVLGKWKIKTIYRTQTGNKTVKCPTFPQPEECPPTPYHICYSDIDCAYVGKKGQICCSDGCENLCVNGVVSGVPDKTIEAEKTFILKKYEMPKVFIQTEKSIYNPGETVRLRVEVQKQDLRPFDGKIKQIIITKPQGACMMQWNDVDFKHGIANVTLPLSTQPVLGKWKIKAIYRTQAVKEIVKCPPPPPAPECPIDPDPESCKSDDNCTNLGKYGKCCIDGCRNRWCVMGLVSRAPEVIQNIEAEKTFTVKKYDKSASTTAAPTPPTTTGATASEKSATTEKPTPPPTITTTTASEKSAFPAATPAPATTTTTTMTTTETTTTTSGKCPSTTATPQTAKTTTTTKTTTTIVTKKCGA